ncbi:MAG: hypothetical protein Q9195_009373 [Heterodermia aff. obscurata]
MAARLKTGHNEPQMPKDALLTTGKEIWYVAPIRPVMQMKTVPGFKSLFVNINCAFVNPSSLSTSNFFAKRPTLLSLNFSMAARKYEYFGVCRLDDSADQL